MDTLDHLVPRSAGAEQHEAVITQRPGDIAHGRLDIREVGGLRDPLDGPHHPIERQVPHPPLTALSNAEAASLPRALPANGLSPVSSLRS